MQLRKPILFLLFVHCFISDHAQYKFDKPVIINSENGLPLGEAGAIRKGNDGFIWIATNEGLCRFDGQSLKVYQAGTDLQHSPFDNTIYSLLPVDNFVWTGTPQGISVLNTRNNTFRHYQFINNKKADTLRRRFDQRILCFYKDKGGTVWIGTRNSGVCSYDEQKDDFNFYPLPREKYPQLTPALGPDNAILSITGSPTSDTIIWAGTLGGLQKINKYTKEVKLYNFPKKDKDYQVALNAFHRVYQHDNGLIYAGSWAAGVNVFDPVAETFTPLQVKNEGVKKMLSSPIGKILKKTDHELWISTNDGLAVYDINLKDVTWFKYNNAATGELYGIELIDDAGRIWCPTTNGIEYFDPAVQQFSSYSFKHLSNLNNAYAFYILWDSSGNDVAVCPRQTDGIYHFNKLTKEWSKTFFPGHESFTRESEAIKGFVRLPPGDYFISSDKGIFLFSAKRKKIEKLNNKLPFNGLLKGGVICDRSGYVWMSYNGQGLVKWKPGTNDYTVFKSQFTASDSGQSGRIIHLFRDSRNNIWYQTTGGLGVFQASDNTFHHFIYAKNEANSFPVALSFAEDKSGKVWLNSDDGWLGFALSNDPAKGVVYKMNTKFQGIEQGIEELATDNNGEVWGYTVNELIKISATDHSFTTYSFQYGVKRADFFQFAFLPSGEMIFGARNDIVIANPGELKRNSEVPVPYIDRVEVLNKPFDFIHNDDPLKLGYKQNFFSILFSAQAFTMAKGVQFRYRLKGFDDWSKITAGRFANYTNVPGGDYIFQLQAANNEGTWNPKILELPVHIDTAFWLTWWFRTAVMILFCAGVYTLYRYRIGMVRKKQQLKWEYEKKLANVEMTALLAQMNPHFIFNSLNSIDSYIIRNESKKASEYLNNFARLMRLILQNSRSNYITLKDELVALELYLQMEGLRFKNKFSYTIDVDEGLDTSAIVIPPMLIQPYIENAIWHGLMTKTNGEPGKVELTIRKQKENLVCTIADNGIGRKKAAALKENKNSNHKRSMGMQITEDRMEIINKLYNLNTSVRIYDMENEAGEATGTRIELIIPI